MYKNAYTKINTEWLSAIEETNGDKESMEAKDLIYRIKLRRLAGGAK